MTQLSKPLQCFLVCAITSSFFGCSTPIGKEEVPRTVVMLEPVEATSIEAKKEETLRLKKVAAIQKRKAKTVMEYLEKAKDLSAVIEHGLAADEIDKAIKLNPKSVEARMARINLANEIEWSVI